MSSSSRSAGSFFSDEESLLCRKSTDFYHVELDSRLETWSPPTRKCSDLSPYSTSRSSPISSRTPTSPRDVLRLEKQADQARLAPRAQYEIKYLNGMRGLAALVVFFCHLSYGTFDIAHVYGAKEPGEPSTNTNLLRLPIVRLFYSGPPMVAIFFVISGYALSYKPVQQMRAKNLEGLLKTLSSSAFRRALRLFLPCFVSTFTVACLAQLGLYKLTEDFAYHMRGVCEDHPWTAPSVMAQLLDWMHNMLNFVNVFDWPVYSGSVHYDRHLWTIPVEMRCSMALFLVHTLVARMSTRLRMSTLLFLIIWGTYWDRCEWVPFLAGAMLAELDLQAISRTDLPNSTDDMEYGALARVHSLWQYACILTFTTGLFLASYPDLDGHLTPGYMTLTKLIPKTFTEKHRFWPNVGAVMIVWSAGNIDLLQRVFTSRLLQWLGKVSFPLYIVHGPVMHTFGYFLMGKIWTHMDTQNTDQNLRKGFLLAASLIVAFTLWLSHVFLKIIDSRCIRFARWMEDKFYMQ